MNQIWLIEDQEDLRTEKVTELCRIVKENKLDDEVEIVGADAKLLNKITSKEAYSHDYISIEDKVALYLIRNRNIKMIVVDRDLTKFKSDIRSESTVSEGGELAAIPVCGYSRRTRGKSVGAALEKIGLDVNQTLIEVSKVAEKLAESVVETYLGFRDIHMWVQSNPRVAEEKEPRRLAKLLGEESQSLYFDGYSNSFPLMTHWIEAESEEYTTTFDSYRLGQLLKKFILPFPGLILNQAHLAAYLNLSQSVFNSSLELFDSCAYNGPFNTFSKYWWRYKIDDLLASLDCSNGSDFITLKTGEKTPSLGNDGEEHVLCMISNKIIPWDNSIRLKMAPTGADLSRIDKDEADQWQMYLP